MWLGSDVSTWFNVVAKVLQSNTSIALGQSFTHCKHQNRVVRQAFHHLNGEGPVLGQPIISYIQNTHEGT